MLSLEFSDGQWILPKLTKLAKNSQEYIINILESFYVYCEVIAYIFHGLYGKII